VLRCLSHPERDGVVVKDDPASEPILTRILTRIDADATT
jgi:hypothetical protein